MINCIDEDGHLYGGWSNVIIAGGLGLTTFKNKQYSLKNSCYSLIIN